MYFYNCMMKIIASKIDHVCIMLTVHLLGQIELTVYAKPNLTIRSEAGDFNQLKLEYIDVKCKADGGYPKMNFSAFIADAHGTVSRNLFLENEKLSVINDLFVYKPSIQESRKFVYCNATLGVGDSRIVVESTRTPLNVLYPPQPAQNSPPLLTRVGNTQITILSTAE